MVEKEIGVPDRALRAALVAALALAMLAQALVSPLRAQAAEQVPAVSQVSWEEAKPKIESYLGTPYVWGGTSPSGFDCSGLTQYCYAQAGYSIPRTTYAQIDQIAALGQLTYNLSDLQPGDLLFPHSGHVGIYCGGGMMIHAPYTGRTVSYDSVYAFSCGGCPV